MMALVPPTPRPPGQLTYEAWLLRTGDYLHAMRAYMEKARAAAAPLAAGLDTRLDLDALYDSLFRYVYRTSINRHRSYTIVDWARYEE